MISVVIPTRNRDDLLQRSLTSVFAQTFHDYEVVVVDDASDTAIHCPSRARLIRHTTRRGAAAARNSGLAAATGELIAFLDDDDEWHIEKLALQAEALRNAPSAVLAYCGYELMLTTSRAILETFTPDGAPLRPADFLRRTYFGCSMPLIRASFLRAASGFDERLGGMQDRDLWLRLSRYGKFVAVPKILVTCHVHGPSISTNLDGKIAAKRDFWTKHATAMAADPIACARHWRRTAMLCFAGGDGRNGRRALRAAHRWVPQGWTRHVHSLASWILPAVHARYVRSLFRGIDGLRWYV